MSYVVEPGSLASAGPKFEALAADAVREGRAVSDIGSDLADNLGDPGVVAAVGSALLASLDSMRSVCSGIAFLAEGVGENAKEYVANDLAGRARYLGAGSATTAESHGAS